MFVPNNSFWNKINDFHESVIIPLYVTPLQFATWQMCEILNILLLSLRHILQNIKEQQTTSANF
jgi:hypothetical protein